MAVTTTVPNKAKYLLQKKVIDLSADTMKAIALAPGFVFNKDTHQVYADIIANELPTQYGYTAGGVTLAGAATSQDDALDKGKTTWNNLNITAAGGNLSFCAVAIIDDTVAAPVVDPVLMCIEFGQTETILNGGTGTIAGLEFDTTD